MVISFSNRLSGVKGEGGEKTLFFMNKKHYSFIKPEHEDVIA